MIIWILTTQKITKPTCSQSFRDILFCGDCVKGLASEWEEFAEDVELLQEPVEAWQISVKSSNPVIQDWFFLLLSGLQMSSSASSFFQISCSDLSLEQTPDPLRRLSGGGCWNYRWFLVTDCGKRPQSCIQGSCALFEPERVSNKEWLESLTK